MQMGSDLVTKYKPFILNLVYDRDSFSLQKCDAKYWIYGHSHRNINKKIGKTYCICNQMGYISDEENVNFSQDVNIDLSKNDEKDKKCIII